jgi:hypothetical protein
MNRDSQDIAEAAAMLAFIIGGFLVASFFVQMCVNS